MTFVNQPLAVTTDHSDVDDAVRPAMEAMIDAVDEVVAHLGPVNARLMAILELRKEGHAYSEMGSHLAGSPVIQMLSAASEALTDATARLRRAAARELRAEGMTMEAIAATFGVSRQRVSALLREARPN
ncbi:MAG: hypothetical protein JO248_16255 [Acidimicrobiia bacterium]|nr:hypothetical protein [Acidimicrobiia bacterium]